MNGGHDVGGMHGFGPVPREIGEQPFHAAWERRMFAVQQALAALGLWTIDISRSVAEDRSPADYMGLSYFEIWLSRVETLALRNGLVTAEELRDGLPRVPAVAVRPPLAAAAVGAHFVRSGSYEREPPAPARFVAGDRVRFRNINPLGHTRLPRYARGHDARIERIHGCHPFPDSNVLGQGESPQWLYAVTLDHSALGYAEVEAGDALVLDAWEPYLEPNDR